MATQSHKVDGRPSVQWYWDDWMTAWDLKRCGAFAKGLWMDMLAIMWTAPRRGYLETYSGQIDADALSRMVGESETDVEQALNRLDTEGVYSKDADGAIYCRRYVRDEITRQNKSRAGKTDRTGSTINRSEAEGGPSTPSSTSSPTSTSILNNSQQEMFDRFWKVYPKKRSKGAAKRAWKKVNPDNDLLHAIIESVKVQSLHRDWTKDEGKFVPYPATWLNAERWDDEVLVPQEQKPWIPPEERGEEMIF